MEASDAFDGDESRKEIAILRMEEAEHARDELSRGVIALVELHGVEGHDLAAIGRQLADGELGTPYVD